MDKGKAIMQLKELKKNTRFMRLAAEKWDRQWKTLIAIILSARTRDEMTIPVARDLFNNYSNLDRLSKANLRDIEKIIRPINFYKNKSKNVLGCARKLLKDHNGRVPRDFEKLVDLPGVGRKTANVFLSEYGCAAIGVDTHVFYISRKLRWSNGKNPEKVEDDLKRLFPKNYWAKVNPILVRFGKTYTSRKMKDVLLLKIRNL
jgi:endonuclease III